MKSVKFGKSVRLTAMLLLTGGFFLVEIIVGYATNSMALVADSFHMLSDVLALVIGLFCVRIARRKSEKNTFGWARAEIVGALVNAVFLCALCFSIFIEAVQRFTKDDEVNNPQVVLIVGVAGLVINLIGLFMFHDHSHGHAHTAATSDASSNESDQQNVQVIISDAQNRGNVTHDLGQLQSPANNAHLPKKNVASGSQMNMKGVFLHVAGDALGSVVVIIAALIIWLTDWKYRHYVDPAMSLLSVVIILTMTIPLLRSSARILLQTVPLHLKAQDVRQRLEKVDGVLAVHELHIWQLAGNRNIASAHIWCKDYQDYKRVANTIKEFFHNEGIHSTTIQPEFQDFDTGRNYYSNLTNPAFCMLTCPEEKKCGENMCCKPERSTSPDHHTPHILLRNIVTGADDRENHGAENMAFSEEDPVQH